MTRRSNLIRRDGGTYYARIYIPSDLRDQFPSEDKKVSLRTKDEAVAKRRLNFELQKWDAEFEDMRARRHLTDEDTRAPDPGRLLSWPFRTFGRSSRLGYSTSLKPQTMAMRTSRG